MIAAVERRAASEYWYIKRFPSKELAGELRALKPEARDLVNCFRDWGFENNGLPTEEADLIAIAETFRFTKYRFRKYWQEVEKFFIRSQGRLYYERDIQQVSKLVEISEQQRENGRAGAAVRWNREVMATPCVSPSEKNGPLAVAVAVTLDSSNTTTAAATAEKGGVGGMPRSREIIFSQFPSVTTKFMERLTYAASQVEPGITDEALSEALRESYGGARQKSAGYWLHAVPAYLANKKNFCGRKEPEPERKPAAFEQWCEHKGIPIPGNGKEFFAAAELFERETGLSATGS